MSNIFDSAITEFYLIHKDYLVKSLEGLPLIKAGKHNDQQVLRIYYDDHHRYKEFSGKNSQWSSVQRTFLQREKIAKMIENTENTLRKFPIKNRLGNCSIINLSNEYDSNFFDRLQDSSCTVENQTEYYYNGRNYRSRSEMIIAIVLDELGVEYKYDVKIMINGELITTDFVIVFREFNRCVLIEYFGRSDDTKKNHRNSLKIETYHNSGIYIGRDLFILSGNIYYTPGADVIRIFLLSIIAEITCYHLEHSDCYEMTFVK